jgi:hypothetical protein
MANGIPLNDPRLRDPIQSVPDGLKDPLQAKTPGFFESLRNPIDLIREESLPASLYQWITGNTKKKQAEEALAFIRNNPNLQGSKLFQEAERKLSRFGYLLDDGPMTIDMKEVRNMVKQNPKLFGAELVNMIMADPYLLFMGFGFHKLGRGVVNAIRLRNQKVLTLSKVSKSKQKALSDIKVGAAATFATPFVFSTVWQGSEDRTLDPKRTALETSIGGTAGALLSVGFAGTNHLLTKVTNINKSSLFNTQFKSANNFSKNPEEFTNYNETGNFKAIDDLLKELKDEVNDITRDPQPRKLDIKYQDLRSDQAMSFFRRSEKDAKEGVVFMDIKRINEAFKNKAWTKPRVEGVDALPANAFKTPKEFQDFILYHELSHWQNPILKGESKAAYENRMNKYAMDRLYRVELDNKVAKDILNSKTKFDSIKADITASMRPLYENAKDMSIADSLKIAGSFAAIGGTAQFLTAEDEKVLATAKGAAAGAGVFVAGKFLLKTLRNSADDFNKASLEAEAGLDAMKVLTVKLNTAGYELANKIKLMIPDAIDSRRMLFYYLTKAKVNRKTFEYDPKAKPITVQELKAIDPNLPKAARLIQKTFNEFADIFGSKGAGLFKNQRSNYLPLLWDNYNPKIDPFKFTGQYDQSISGISPSFQFAKRTAFEDINKGLQTRVYKIKPGFDDPTELIKIYVSAAGKALATRSLISNLERTTVNSKPLLVRNIKTTPIDGDYVKFKHPYFEEDVLGEPFIQKGMEKSLRMVFDATDEQALLSAIFTTNLMMKRLAVGFSFFHAGALVESMIFAGHNLKSVGRLLKPYNTKELQSFIDNPGKYVTEFPHAVQVLEKNGYRDVIQFARGSGVQISTPEDVGFDRFYYNLRALQKTPIDQFWKRHFGISPTEKTEKVFRWFDRITWDRIFTHAKLNTFLTALEKTVQTGDTHDVILRKAQRAAQFANDAFGGQDWAKVANSIQTPWLKSMMQTTFRPGSRGYMQLLMFAPDWTISNIRIIAKSLPAFEADPDLRRLYQYYFLRAALIYAAAGTAMNYAFSGKSLLENTDPTRIDLGDGQVLTFSKQLMEPFHWITDPQSTGLKKIGSLPRTTIEVLTNKQYLTTKWSPNITTKDDEAIEKGLKIGGHVGMRFLPIWLQSASRDIAEKLQSDGLSLDEASDTAVDFVLGQLGHPRYQGPRYTQYKTKGLIRDPYKTLF